MGRRECEREDVNSGWQYELRSSARYADLRRDGCFRVEDEGGVLKKESPVRRDKEERIQSVEDAYNTACIGRRKRPWSPGGKPRAPPKQ